MVKKNEIKIQESISYNVIKELYEKDLIVSENLNKIQTIITSHFLKIIPLDFNKDTELLNESIAYNVRSYFLEIIEPIARRTYNNKKYGRLLNDEEHIKATQNITLKIIEELGDVYKQRLSVYFGDEEPFIKYVFKRVKDRLLSGILEYNKGFLNKILINETTALNNKEDDNTP